LKNTLDYRFGAGLPDKAPERGTGQRQGIFFIAFCNRVVSTISISAIDLDGLLSSWVDQPQNPQQTETF
jgi:hypothetical protein